MNMHDRNLLREENVRKVVKDGPRLRTDYNTWIEARDRKRKEVLIGGLGAFGVGQMWFPEKGHEEYPGFEDAPELDMQAYLSGYCSWPWGIAV